MTAEAYALDKDGIPCQELRDWEHAKQELNDLPRTWVFRGQSRSDYDLQTSLERCIKGDAGAMRSMGDWEDDLIVEFRRAAHHYLKPGEIPDVDDRLEWLALMQHYGAPTRLLDWTRSPYVASFFAFEGADGPSAVWAFDTQWCHRAARGVAEIRHAAAATDDSFAWPDGRITWTMAQCNDLLFGSGSMMIISLEPFRMNERLSIQRGLFLIPCSLDQPFMDLLKTFARDELSQCVRKFILPSDARRLALPDLNRMNINRASLFPGLDGYAGSLRLYPTIYEQDVWER